MLRIYLSNTSHNQTGAQEDSSSLLVDRSPTWTFKIQGALVDKDSSQTIPAPIPKFSSFFKRILIEVGSAQI
jgi:hypothetical protein